MTFYTRNSVLGAAIEDTVGTAEAVDATDAAFNIFNASMQPNIEQQQREGSGGFDYISSLPAGFAATCTFRTYAEWDGTSTEPSWADTFLPACGWVKDTNTYTPRSEAAGSNVKTLTIALWEDGLKKVMTGCMGTAVATLISGNAIYFDWTFRGVWQAVSDEAMPTPTYPNVNKARFAGGTATWNSVSGCARQATIDLGNEVVLRECPTQAGGYISATIANRRPRVTLDPEAVLIATQNRWLPLTSPTEYALALTAVGEPGTSSNATIGFNAPKAQLINNQTGDRNGIRTDQLEFQCNRNGSTQDQSLSIVFTPKVDS